MGERNEDVRSVFCGNISEKANEEILYELFLQAGPVESVHIPKNPDGKPKGFGFVCFKHEESVPYTITLMEGIALFGRTLTIKPRTGNEMPFNPYSNLLKHQRTRSCPENSFFGRNQHDNRGNGMYESRQSRINEEQLRMSQLAMQSQQSISRNLPPWNSRPLISLPPIQMWSTFSQRIIQPGMTGPQMINHQMINQTFTQFNPQTIQHGNHGYTDFSSQHQFNPRHEKCSRNRKHFHTPYR